MKEDKLDQSEKSIYRLTDEKEKLLRRRRRNETFRTVMIVFAAVTLSASFVVPQLRRYYDLNLQQNKWMLGLGIGCIVLGTIMISGTVGLIVSRGMPPEEKIIAAVLGGMGSFLTNFVAFMYLRMNTLAARNLTSFHTRLVKTHDLLMSNLLISIISINITAPILRIHAFVG